MKKWFATLLVGLLALCWCGSALADELPETDEITAYVPASICWGEDLTVSAVLPTDSGHLRVAVNTPYTVARDNWISDRSVEYTFEANEMIEQGLKPGNYFVTFNWQNDAQEQTVCLPLEVTGEEKAPPTISSDKLYAMAGETVVFSGEAGAASKIHLDIYWQEYDTISDLHVDVNAEADGTWSYEAVMPANACMYSVRCEGYTADGLATGRLERISVGVYDADIPAPALQLITENPVANSTIRISMETAGVSTESWIVKLVDEATGEIRSPWYSNWEPYTCEVLTDYGGEYTLYASYCANGKLSVPAELHITSDGSAHPSNGKIPINVTAPAAILAGQDAVFAIDYADDSQTVNYVFGQMDESGEFRMDYYSRTVSAGKPFTIPGYLLYNGAFCRLVVRSEAEDWYSNSEDYSFTVSSNPDQSQAPVLSLAEEQSVYYGIPVRLSAGEGWDRVAIRYTENGDSSNWELYNPSKIYFTCFSAGNVKIIARGLKNGVWSEVSQPLALTVEEVPQVDEITPLTPSSIVFGEDLPVAVLLPEGEGEILISLDLPNEYSESLWINTRYCSNIINASTLFSWRMMPGRYTVTYTWNHDGQTETVTRPLEVTGEAKTPITVSADHTSATEGDTVVFSGETGDASRIEVNIQRETSTNWTYDSLTLNVTPGDSWSYSYTVPEDSTYLVASFTGYTSNGLLTSEIYGYNNFIYDTSLAAPSLQLLTENPSTEESVTLTAETTAENVEHMVMVWIDDTTGEAESGWSYNDQRIEYSFYPSYAGEYTVQAYYSIDGRLSAPAELHITVTGTPHPSHGKVPIEVTAPETVLAGRDAVFALDYAAEGQSFNWNLDKWNEDGGFVTVYWGGTLRNGEALTVPGYLLEANAAYRLSINSEAEDWYSYYRDYQFTVSANPDQPQAPVLALAEGETAHTRIPVRFTVDEGWEKISLRYVGDNSSFDWEEYNPNDLSLRFDRAETVQVYAHGLKNGVWSEVSEPLTITVEELPPVTEIIPLTSSSMRWGDNLPISVLFPNDHGTFRVTINTPDVSNYSWEISDTDQIRSWLAASNLIDSGLKPGTYTITYTWIHSGQTETVTRPLEVTGEVKTPITVSKDHTSATAGDTIVFSGETGDASRIEGYIEWSNNEDWTSDNFTLNVTPGGSWSYSVTVPEGWTRLYASFAGYTSAGLYTGTINGSHDIRIYDTSLAAPAIQLLTENPMTEKNNRMSVEAPTEIEYWDIYWIDETTGERNGPWLENTQHSEFSFYPGYAGEYTVYASYFANGGKRSAPAELHITVTGTPHPSHGKIPINITAPEAIPAGRDAVFALDYAVEGQSFNWNLDKWNEDGGFDTVYWGDTLRNGDAITVPGYLLQAGMVYNVNISSYAADWYSNYRDYQFTVSANPDQPQAPALALAEGETAYTRIPVRFTVDEGWEKISLRYVGDDSSSEWNEYNPSNLSLRFDVAETVQVYAHGLKNGVWSEVSQPLTLTVEELPQVTEITPLTPSSVRWGEDLLVSALFPYDYGTVSVTINTPDPYSDNSYLNSHVYSQRFYASGMIHYGLMPGSYTITYTWEDGDQTETISRPLEVTGDAKEPSTISVDRNYAVEGDQIVYSGETGDAVRIQLQIRRYIDQQELIDYVWLNVTPNSTWSYTVTAQENVSEYATYCEGYTSDNLCTGYNYAGSVEICDASLAAPTIQLLTENPMTGQENRMSVEAPTEIEYWDIYWVDETTGDIHWLWIGDTRCSEFYPNMSYAGEYTVYASYFANGGKRSVPAELHLTVTGTPHPSHGKVPIEFTAPEAILAGQDAVFALDYAAEGQSFNWNLDKWNEYNSYSTVYWGNTLRNGEALTVPGYLLEADAVYRLRISSEAEDWYSNYRDYEFMVSANPDQPQPPVLTMEDEEAFIGAPVRFSVDDGWETIAVKNKITKDGSTSNDNWYRFSSSTKEWLWTYWEGTTHVTVYVKGLKNGVWSAASQPVDFDVIDAPKLGQVQVASAPKQLTVGQPFTVVLEPLENAERYKISLLYYNNDNGQLVDVGCGLSYNQPVLTFPSWNWDDFEGEGYFQIVLSAEADGYNGLTSEYRISLTGAKPSPVEERVYTLPSALTEIEEEAFAESNATVIVVPSGCQSIGKKAFADCASLTRIVIPATVTAIADDAFDGCGTLTIVTSQGSAAYDLALDKGYTLDLSN